jgi:hypothetical protein
MVYMCDVVQEVIFVHTRAWQKIKSRKHISFPALTGTQLGPALPQPIVKSVRLAFRFCFKIQGGSCHLLAKFATRL